MMWAQAMGALRRELLAQIDARITRLFGWTLSANSSEMGDGDQVQTADGGESQRPVQRIEPFGLRSRAPAKVRQLWIRLGASNVLTIGIQPTKGYGPTDIDDGETALYNAVLGCVLKLSKDGVIHIGQNGGLDSADGLVHGRGTDTFTGASYADLGNACANVRAKKD